MSNFINTNEKHEIYNTFSFHVGAVMRSIWYTDYNLVQIVTTITMMTSSNGNIFALLALCEGNPPVTGGFPSQRPVTRSFGVFFDLRKRLGAPVVCDAIALIMTSLWWHNGTLIPHNGHQQHKISYTVWTYVCCEMYTYSKATGFPNLSMHAILPLHQFEMICFYCVMCVF